MTEEEMVGWHHRLNEHEFEQAPGDGEGQGSLVCCSSCSCKELDMTEHLNNNNSVSVTMLPAAELPFREKLLQLILLSPKHSRLPLGTVQQGRATEAQNSFCI